MAENKPKFREDQIVYHVNQEGEIVRVQISKVERIKHRYRYYYSIKVPTCLNRNGCWHFELNKNRLFETIEQAEKYIKDDLQR